MHNILNNESISDITDCILLYLSRNTERHNNVSNTILNTRSYTLRYNTYCYREREVKPFPPHPKLTNMDGVSTAWE